MIKIAFCDDDVEILDNLGMLLNKYRMKSKEEIVYTTYRSALELVLAIERGARYDILFLDILMPRVNGIEVAREIGSYDRNVKIIFLTSSAEFAVQSYTVGAYYYQLKPITEEKLFRLLDCVIAECEKEQVENLVLRCKNGISRIEVKRIEYCAVHHRTLYIHMTNGQIFESIGSMDELEKHLINYDGFIRPHRSYLINIEYVQSISYRAITMVCLDEIPVPRGKYNEIKSAFLEYTFQKGQIIV